MRRITLSRTGSSSRSFASRSVSVGQSFITASRVHTSIPSYRMASTLPKLPVFEAIARHDPDSTVVIHSNSGRTFKYGELLGDVCRTRNRIYEKAGKTDIQGERIAFLVENSYDYVGKLSHHRTSCCSVQGKPTTDSAPSHLISCVGRKVNSCASFAGLPGAGAPVHPQPQRGVNAAVISQVCAASQESPCDTAEREARLPATIQVPGRQQS